MDLMCRCPPDNSALAGKDDSDKLNHSDCKSPQVDKAWEHAFPAVGSNDLWDTVNIEVHLTLLDRFQKYIEKYFDAQMLSMQLLPDTA